jgi:hypothetical protein
MGIGDWAQSPIPNPQKLTTRKIFYFTTKINNK